VAIEIYRKTRGEPKLQLAPPGTKNVDALSREGKRYSIKTIRYSRTTGTFQVDDFSEKRFDYLILVVLDEYYQPVEILEAPWEVVNRHKRYHTTMRAFNISATSGIQYIRPDEVRKILVKLGFPLTEAEPKKQPGQTEET
jgi:hypothetical protein